MPWRRNERTEENIRQKFEYDSNDKELEQTAREMQKTVQKTVLWESESLIRKVLSGLLT